MGGLAPLEFHHLALNNTTLRSRARRSADPFIRGPVETAANAEAKMEARTPV